MNSAISIKNLSKDYGQVHALQNVTLEIPAGKITGLVGPNGAGKSTLIKALVGALQPSAGLMNVLELNPIRKRWNLRKQIGYMPQEPALYTDLSARENVLFYARVHRSANARGLAEQLLNELNLADRLDSAVHTLSGGMQKRVSLACALIHNPKLLILDEPTAALDPLLKRHLWVRFKKLAAAGKTLLISTHLIDEAMLCDNVVLLQHGRVVANDMPQALIASGAARIRYRGETGEWSETVSATGTALAVALQKHGLSQDIASVEIEAENLEDVMVARLEQQGKGKP
ncbi:MAG: ABC transporter ATP-binding protein [Candidatus Kerfeldbacteria bacterium CG08_land_8_20_14_0_20_40_16]|uniref:ABC transporter ATP-binding protein n=1 Tax=Candidatus Kerfeldbacteria bacterium CG08_land_8_20_14_0_20_40_16 TaxID=2014244 RepID=A0A2H0YWZ9_9BACT|nr:MAG: ABC transporter ATP-binding protein [Candidatus Kerfeldbacteria bacterium CG08_land_8_20_14_0_20_40_16]